MRYTEPHLDHLTPDQARDVLADVCQILWNRGDYRTPHWDPDKEFTTEDQGELLALLERHGIRPYDNGLPDDAGTEALVAEKAHLRELFRTHAPFVTSILITYHGEDGDLQVDNWATYDGPEGHNPLDDLPAIIGDQLVGCLERAIETFTGVVIDKLYPGGPNGDGCEGDISFNFLLDRVTVMHSTRVSTLEESPKRLF